MTISVETIASVSAGRARPFFSTGDGVPERRRRLLLLSYHFPPGSTAGALRWRKLAALAAERGWSLDVVTLDPSALGATKSDGLADLPTGTRVFVVSPPVLGRDRIVTTILGSLRRLKRRSPEARTAAPAHAPVSQPTAVAAGRPDILRRTYGALYDNAIHGGWAAAAEELGNRLASEQRYDVVISCGPPHMAHVAVGSPGTELEFAL